MLLTLTKNKNSAVWDRGEQFKSHWGSRDGGVDLFMIGNNRA